MIFADIVQRFDTPLNALYRERDARRAIGQKVIDLVSGNVNRAGFIFPPKILQQALIHGAERARIYAPDPLGQPVAREAIQRYYKEEGVAVPTEQIVLTPGTSVSYLYLFKILAQAGDEILCPTPSYPLLDSIAEFCGVRLTHYRLRESSRWDIDLEHLRAQITSRTRAIVLISPHNPTGAVATPAEVTGLAKIAAEKGLPILADEVFSAFLFHAPRLPRPATHDLPLVFTLNGLSKMFALPGLKIGWIAVTGKPALVKKAVHALDMVSDTFLPVAEVAQFALPSIFKYGKPFLSRFRKDVQARAALVMKGLQKAQGLSVIEPEGGFYLTAKITSGLEEEAWALERLKTQGLLVHPGYFYEVAGSHIVLSFVAPLNIMKSAIPRLAKS